MSFTEEQDSWFAIVRDEVTHRNTEVISFSEAQDELLPTPADRELYGLWSRSEFATSLQKILSFSREFFVDFVENHNFFSYRHKDQDLFSKWSSQIRNSAPEWIPLGWTDDRLYRLEPAIDELPDPWNELPEGRYNQDHAVSHTLGLVGAKLTHAQTPSKSTDAPESNEQQQVMFLQLGNVRFHEIYGASDRNPSDDSKIHDDGYWISSGFALVARIAPSGRKDSLWLVFNTFPNFDDEDCSPHKIEATSPEWGMMRGSSYKPFSCAKISGPSMFTGRDWTTPFGWEDEIETPIKLVPLVRLPAASSLTFPATRSFTPEQESQFATVKARLDEEKKDSCTHAALETVLPAQQDQCLFYHWIQQQADERWQSVKTALSKLSIPDARNEICKILPDHSERLSYLDWAGFRLSQLMEQDLFIRILEQLNFFSTQREDMIEYGRWMARYKYGNHGRPRIPIGSDDEAFFHLQPSFHEICSDEHYRVNLDAFSRAYEDNFWHSSASVRGANDGFLEVHPTVQSESSSTQPLTAQGGFMFHQLGRLHRYRKKIVNGGLLSRLVLTTTIGRHSSHGSTQGLLLLPGSHLRARQKAFGLSTTSFRSWKME
ncbi:hypothetical protein IWZ00DRAFT_530801 [Phyllosticta capitalensis]|uniref:uncharacterized protein n=1 Tax=Phyllosticta capitalensis TaxID=121624 RepID=UPI00313134EF